MATTGIYIIVNNNNVVSLAGSETNDSMTEQGYFLYTKVIPTHDDSYQYLTYNKKKKKIIVKDDMYLKDTTSYNDRKSHLFNGSVYSLNSVDYKVSLTNRDAIGVMQIFLASTELGLTSTNATFQNGTVIPFTSAREIIHFVKWFSTSRAAYFTSSNVILKPNPDDYVGR